MASARAITNRAAIVAMVVSMLVALLAVAGAAPAGAAEQCPTFAFRNTLDESIKVKRLTNNGEITIATVAAGSFVRISDIQSDETLIVRRPSDFKRLWTSDGCSGITIDISEDTAPFSYTCLAFDRPGSETLFRVRLDGTPAGAKVIYNLERGDRTGENFVFIGADALVDPVIDVSKFVTGAEGTWFAKVRVRLADGTKLPRVDCGRITLSDEVVTEFPAGVADNAPLSIQDTSCWVVERTVDGELRSDVSIIDDGSARVIYARTDTKFLGDVTDAPGLTAPGATKVRVRGGDNPGTYQCEDGWAGNVDLDREEITDVRVLTATPASNGGTNVLWTVNRRGFGNAGGGSQDVYITNTITGERVNVQVENATPLVMSCDQQFLAARSADQGGFSYFVVDLDTGVREFADTAEGRAFDFGFDCDGRFWFEDFQDGVVSFIDLPFVE